MKQKTANHPRPHTPWLRLDGITLRGRFRAEQLLLCSGHSEIHLVRATDPRPAEPSQFLLKALNLRLAGEWDAALAQTLRENFAREASALRQLQHPHIVQVWAEGTAQDATGLPFSYLVLEYLPGGTLQQLLAQRSFSFGQRLLWLEQVSAGLMAAHAQGIWHRDLKPANIALTADLQVAKVIDFGVARWGHEETPLTLVGTPIYAAPEQFQEATGYPVTAATDVYGLAKTAYYVLTGQAPTAFRQRPITCLPPSVATQPWATSLLAVLRRATQDNPADRYPTAQGFCQALTEALEQTTYAPRGTAARFRSRRGVDIPPAPSLRRGVKGLVGKILLVALGTVLLLWGAAQWAGWWRGPQQPTTPAMRPSAAPPTPAKAGKSKGRQSHKKKARR